MEHAIEEGWVARRAGILGSLESLSMRCCRRRLLDASLLWMASMMIVPTDGPLGVPSWMVCGCRMLSHVPARCCCKGVPHHKPALACRK